MEALPSGPPPEVRSDIEDPDFEALLESARLDELVFDASQGLGSRAYHFVPDGPPQDTTLIFLLGHAGDFSGEVIIPESFVPDGYPVLELGMILQGPNRSDRSIELPGGDKRTVGGDHSVLGPLTSEGLNAMRLFMQPVALAVDYALARSERVVLAGISGGGWTVDVYAALDPRLAGAVSISGSIPHPLREGADLGDFEQRIERPIYAIAGFETLYLLSAMEQPHRQVFYEFDACCFRWSERAPAFFAYATEVQDELTELGRAPDRFDLEMVPDRSVHTTQPEAVDLIRALLEDGAS